MSRLSGSECSAGFRDGPFAAGRPGDPPSANEGGTRIRMKKRREKRETVLGKKDMIDYNLQLVLRQAPCGEINCADGVITIGDANVVCQAVFDIPTYTLTFDRFTQVDG